ncbi:MAG: ferredoxin family protein [Deltaproteobacteria bacterium]|nr:ferredoxin family protein [Deltaproteobacteria bacterium]
MTHVINQKCISEVYSACVQVCPADCMHYVAALPAGYPSEGQPMVVVDPVECIDCGACLPECPIGAIVDSAEADTYWAQINANLAPSYKGQKNAIRAENDPPRRPDNTLI